MRAPFPWFGGKSRAAHLIWPRLGEVPNYIEPFAGSLAVLLARPDNPRIETANDLDCHIANFWRALAAAPDQVAKYADWPVNEADLHARHLWLVTHGRKHVEKVKRNPKYYNAMIAGWWVWGQCLWIGSGWGASPEWTGRNKGARQNLTGTQGVHKWKKPPNSHRGPGKGVTGLKGSPPHKRFAGTGNGQGTGVHRRWNGGGRGGGSGVNAPGLSKQKPQLSGERSGASRGLLGEATRTQGLYEYLWELSARLRRVRVCCGDWKRVLTPAVTTYIGVTGVLLDPPYDQDRRSICYAEDHNVSAPVREWALEHGDDPKFRIALCGYKGEHDMPDTWEEVKWKANGGYSRSVRGKANRDAERIWFSPYCLKDIPPLFRENQ